MAIMAPTPSSPAETKDIHSSFLLLFCPHAMHLPQKLQRPHDLSHLPCMNASPHCPKTTAC